MKLNLRSIKQSVTRLGRVARVKLYKNGPDIAIIGGVITMGLGAVAAGKESLKLNSIVDEAKENLEKADTYVETKPDEYSEEDREHDKKLIYIQTGLKIAKLYAPSAAMVVGGAASILMGNKMHRKRAATLTASLAAATESFREYRKRVAEKYGKEEEYRLRYNIHDEKVEETEIDPNTGKEKKVKKKVDVVDPELAKYSPYAAWFDEASREWSKDPNQNFMFLRAQQKIANAKLIADGYLFLNDVYAALDIPETEEGHYVGWIYDEKNGKDNFVDFGMYDIRREVVRDFVNGYERTILLDFNVDGPIIDKVKWGRR